jgi:hypothetical protein
MGKVCKNCGESVERLWSRGRCYWCSQMEYARNRKKQTLPSSKKKSSPKVLLDLIFAKYLKKRNMMSDGKIFCFTSFKTFDLNKIDAGHFFDRGYMRYRWDFKNVFPQSITDNRFKSGNLEQYQTNLESLYGEDFVELRKQTLYEPYKIHADEIKHLISLYTEEYEKLEIDPMIGTMTDYGRIMWFDGESYIALGDKLELI